MNAKHNFYSYMIAFLFLLSGVTTAGAITPEELASICEVMESSIVDVSLEYEWFNIPPWTAEEAKAEMGVKMLIVKEGIRRFKFSAAGLLSNSDPNDPNSPQFDRLLLEESTTIVTEDGNSWDNVIKQSYNGSFGKSLIIGGWPQETRTGIISKKKPPISPILSPLGFSVLRFIIDDVTDKLPLSVILRRYKELVCLDSTVEKANGFNTIRADLLQEWTKQVCMRVYFSVDHAYTPVRYEYMNGGKPSLTIEVDSLEKVAKGLWFPSGGFIISDGRERVDAFQTISKTIVNQGLTDEHFDIDFPVGTEVRDDIKNTKYIVKPK